MVSMQYTLTTIDNPYNPFDQFDKWILFDMEKGYNTCSKLARIARTCEAFTERENDLEVERAVDEMIRYDFAGIYKKVGREIDYEKLYGFDEDETDANKV